MKNNTNDRALEELQPNRKHYYENREVYVESEIVEHSEDVTKLWHSLRDAKTGETLRTIDWSPYSEMDHEDISLYLELGCPKRTTYAPLNKKDLLDLKKEKLIKEKLVSVVKANDENLII